MYSLFAWGAGTSGQLAQGPDCLQDQSSPTPLQLLLPSQPQGVLAWQLTCGGSHAAAVIDSTCWTWGRDHAGAGPQDTTADSGRPAARDDMGFAVLARPTVVPLGGAVQVSLVACGWEHTLFVSGCSRVWAAGDNSHGQLGLGCEVPHARRPLPLDWAAHLGSPHPGLRHGAEPAATYSADCQWRVTSVACGLWHSLLLLRRRGAERDVLPGTEVEQGPAATAEQLRQEQEQEQAIADHCHVLGFGSNRRFQLCRRSETGSGTRPKAGPGTGGAALRFQGTAAVRACTNVFTPAGLDAAFRGMDIVELAAGGDHSGAILSDGHALVWGRAFEGPSSTGDTCSGDDSTGSQGASRGTSSVAGHPGSSSAVRRAAASRASSQPDYDVPHEVPLPAAGSGRSGSSSSGSSGSSGAWVQLSLGWHHCLLLDDRGRVWALGSNAHGQLGQGPAEDETAAAALVMPGVVAAGTNLRPSWLQWLPSRPRLVRGLPPSGSRSVSAGAEHSVAVAHDGRIFTWGWNEHGQLGLGHSQDCAMPSVISAVPGPGQGTSGAAAGLGQGAEARSSNLQPVATSDGLALPRWDLEQAGSIRNPDACCPEKVLIGVQGGSTHGWIHAACGGGFTVAVQGR